MICKVTEAVTFYQQRFSDVIAQKVHKYGNDVHDDVDSFCTRDSHRVVDLKFHVFSKKAFDLGLHYKL